MCFLLLALFASSCMEVTDIPVEHEEPKLVVDGGVFNGDGPFYIHLQKSTNLNSSSPDFVENASVTISDNKGQFDVLQYEGEGRYRTNSLQGIPGNTYDLTIDHEGEQFEAHATMPEVPDVESITTKYYEKSVFREEGYYIGLHGLDLKVPRGYYRALVYKNDSLYNPLGISDVFITLLNEDQEYVNMLELPFNFKLGENIDVHIIRIEQAAYEYYIRLSLSFSSSGVIEQAPVNPVSNLSNGALGLFKAQAIKKEAVVIK